MSTGSVAATGPPTFTGFPALGGLFEGSKSVVEDGKDPAPYD